MSNNSESTNMTGSSHKRHFVTTLLGAIVMIISILATLEISQRNLNTFVAAQQKYIVSVEGIILVAFIVEMLAGLTTMWHSPTPRMIENRTRVRLVVRIVGYSIGSLSVISILASNAALGISVGAIAGIVIAFATQSIVGNVLAAVVILSSRVVRVGEEITVSQTTGTVSDINLTHTVLSIDSDVVFVPNSLIISGMVRRKKRNPDKDAQVRDW